MGAYGIASVAGEDEEIGRLEDRARLISAELAIEDNLMRCRAGGILLAGATIFLAASTRHRRYVLDECEEAGIVVIGSRRRPIRSLARNSHIEIRGNTLGTVGEGIRVGTNYMRILDNDIGAGEGEGDGDVALRGGNGIALSSVSGPGGGEMPDPREPHPRTVRPRHRYR